MQKEAIRNYIDLEQTRKERETRDLVFKIMINDAVCELQLVVKQDECIMHLTHSLYELMRSFLGCTFASYILMAKKFNYPFLVNCKDIVELLKMNTNAKSCKVVESTSYIIHEMKDELNLSEILE